MRVSALGRKLTFPDPNVAALWKCLAYKKTGADQAPVFSILDDEPHLFMTMVCQSPVSMKVRYFS